MGKIAFRRHFTQLKMNIIIERLNIASVFQGYISPDIYHLGMLTELVVLLVKGTNSLRYSSRGHQPDPVRSHQSVNFL